MNTKIMRGVAFLIALAGLALLLSTPALNDMASSAIMARHGGSMDTNMYLSELQAALNSYRVLGAVLLGVGLFRGLER